MCPLSALQAAPAGQRVSKFDDHLPLYRQHEIFERMGRRHCRSDQWRKQ